MTPQDKLHWFWATGALPGTIFDDLNDRQLEKTRPWDLPRRRPTRRPNGSNLRRSTV